MHEQVLAFVEGALGRTNPGKAFTIAVLAALPVTFASSAKAVTIQRLLARLGYLDGKLSRRWDSDTIKALAQFLAAEGHRLAVLVQRPVKDLVGD